MQSLVLVGESSAAKDIRQFARRAGESEHTLLLQGETGVGKDHLAEYVHGLSGNSPQRPFVPVDCGAISEGLSETELFGHAAGAFTDGRKERRGLIEAAEGGTLFFNEIANMSLGLQAKFLRILEKRSYRPVGSTREQVVSARIIAATNVDLEGAVRKGQLRADLYHRLNVLSFTIPPLRERKSDILLLVKHFLRHQGADPERLEVNSLEVLEHYCWPGNIRELQHAVTRAIFVAHPDQGIMVSASSSLTQESGEFPTFEQMKTQYLRDLFGRYGTVSEAARVSGLNRKTLYAYKKVV